MKREIIFCITSALQKHYSADFQAGLSQVAKPYGDGGVSNKVVEVMKHYPIEGLVKKVFHDLPIC